MRYLLVFVASFILASCQTNVIDYSTFGDKAATVADTSVVDYYPDDQLLVEGKAQFKARNYGKSYALFKKSIEVMPNDPVAWLGYAASADQLRRFDSSDIAYKKLSGMIGSRPEYFNNVGYSYLLRGDLRQARRYFLKAYEIDPANEITANNIELLRNSIYTPKRSAEVSKGL
jgi:Flp pilus assembly protein TadD